MPVAKRPGYYVENRFFKDNYHQALARAKFLANEYGRKVDVMYLAPEDCGSVNNAVPYSVAECLPEVAKPPMKSDYFDALPRGWDVVRAEWADIEPVDVRGFMVPKP